MYNQIAKADIIVSDMTGQNPNVFYEVGYAHALNKTVILLTQKADDIPFNLKHFPHIVYEERISDLKDELRKRVKYHVANPQKKADKGDAIVLYVNGEPLIDDAWINCENWRFELALENQGDTILRAGEGHLTIQSAFHVAAAQLSWDERILRPVTLP